jgi:hypothetical protein
MPAAVARLKRGGDDGRDGLRVAIARRAEAADAVQDHKAALDRARSIIASREKALERATRAIAEAKGEQARVMADALVSGDDDAADGTGIVLAVEAVRLHSISDLEAARAALKRLQAQQTEVANALALAEANISAAINLLLAPFAREALEQLKELDRQIAPRLGLLKWVLEIGSERGPRLRDDTVSELRAEEAIRRPLESLRREVNEYFAARITADVQSAMRAWVQARDDLRGNPDAPLPGT